jgi:hypothetical protein
MSHGSPSGTLCLACFHVRQKEVDRRIAAKKVRSPVRQFRAALVTTRELEHRRSVLGVGADAAVRLGADTLNACAEQAAKQLVEAIEDPTSEFHREALELVANRIMPQKVYSNAGARLARSGALGVVSKGKQPAAPRFVVNVGLTFGPEKE